MPKLEVTRTVTIALNELVGIDDVGLYAIEWEERRDRMKGGVNEH